MVAEQKLTKKDFTSDQEVRWCPGCGDYAILTAVQKTMPELGIPPHNVVFFSGIGCSGRFPYYMNTYGFHGIHGRAPAFATGLKMMRPELSVWIVTGDGDSMSIGGNHFIHVLRRNVDVKILMFNNRIYGLTKGQYSPTSEQGKKTRSTPYGSLDNPFNPVSVALGAGATFVARAIDVEVTHLTEMVKAAAAHKGAAFVEIYQTCVVFNDGAFENMTDRKSKHDTVLFLEHGKPMVFGKSRDKGIRLRGLTPEVVTIGENGVTEADLLVHDAYSNDPVYSFLLSQILPPVFPTPVGILRSVQLPTYDALNRDQLEKTTAKVGRGDIDTLLRSGELWTVS
ncbi:MAG: 2-oxoacid:ferredoxin oxidoreductase subunit beta [Deltaproteobacteria bacterium]|nr:2-oxoacid:ferredoxin oxidoreductase subunit beta [Deltaproteobacteria bacterium]